MLFTKSFFPKLLLLLRVGQAVAVPTQQFTLQDLDKFQEIAKQIAEGTHHAHAKVDDTSGVHGLEVGHQRGFHFENPSLDCKYTSQPLIYDKVMKFAVDTLYLWTLLDEQCHWTITGHFSLAGSYRNSTIFFVNSLWRLRAAFDMETFGIEVYALHGGCDSDMAMLEMHFFGTTLTGAPWHQLNLWSTRWEDDRIVEARAYIDGAQSGRLVKDYEVWSNSTQDTERDTLMPGPLGMPPMKMPPDGY
ncbi:hypothetical protein CERZMDRAFT_94128 [Cercospora zeae-maydis SCOH1-5]|uniref:SnoaL-like domain-containing protein n=1 Tax=Cercospora zeae-maydis SCOH1-5 TaxID=717836 RepID=A0A6A6FQJ6_9PEZI|nr:hypothetical protein CERZMDRAFT_94128 [Cercospora zeae-maydis SCOH1-5]